jgi:dTDP-4-dehydrorhamnose reductase
MKIVIIGSNGQLGSDLCITFKENGDQIVALNHDDIEISSLGSVNSVMNDVMPDIVFNTASMLNVEVCEKRPEEAFLINSVGARNLAQISNNVGYTLIHISTDYVFDGIKKVPYVETDCPNPLNVYGNTKLSGELFISNIANKYFIMRVSGLYGASPCRAKKSPNFVKLMLKLSNEQDKIRVVDDEVLTPTYTHDVAQQAILLSRSDDYGIYHVTAEGSCSWYEFASKIFELTNTSVTISIANPGEFATKVCRPKYSVLENQALHLAGIDIMPHWIDGLQRYLCSI